MQLIPGFKIASANKQDDPVSFTIGTWNLRYDTASVKDPLPPRPSTSAAPVYQQRFPGTGYGEKPWAERRWKVLDTLLWHDVDVVCFQEALVNQCSDLSILLGPAWDWRGVGRDDGKEAGEYSPVFWKKEVFKFEAVKYIWLSKTPDVPGSKDWDASQTRIASLVTLSLRSTSPAGSGRPRRSSLVHVVATHWDDQGRVSRAHSGEILRDLVPQECQRIEGTLDVEDDGESLILIGGDLNSPAEEEGYKNITSPSPCFLNTRTLASLYPHPHSLSLPFGPRLTYTGFGAYDRGTEIDFVFVHEKCQGRWKVDMAGTVDNWVDGDESGWKGRVSDHRLVLAKIMKTL